MHGSPKALCSDIDVHDNALGLASQPGVSIGHGESNHLVWLAPWARASEGYGTHFIGAGNDLGELALLFILTLDNGFDDGRVVASEVHEDIGYAIFPQGLEEGERSRVTAALISTNL
jgi:hypothetical protein